MPRSLADEPVSIAAELLALTRAVRAHLSWQAMTGAHAMPSVPFDLPLVEAHGEHPRAAHSMPLQPAPILPQRPARTEHYVPDAPAFDAPLVHAPTPRAAIAAPVAMPAARIARSLDVVSNEVAQCTKCSLHESRARTVFARGNPQAALMIVGEGPGQEDETGGEPFVGPAGELLDRMIRAMGLDPATEVYVCNVMKCRAPEDRKVHMAEIKMCAHYLEEQIAAVRPKVLLAMGNTALTGLLATSAQISKVRGQWKLYKGETLLMPTYHPSYLLRAFPGQAEAKRQTWEDLQMVMKELGLPAKA